MTCMACQAAHVPQHTLATFVWDNNNIVHIKRSICIRMYIDHTDSTAAILRYSEASVSIQLCKCACYTVNSITFMHTYVHTYVCTYVRMFVYILSAYRYVCLSTFCIRTYICMCRSCT